MRVLEILKEENEGVKERYELARQRIALFGEERSVREPFRGYFIEMAEFIEKLTQVVDFVFSGELYKLPLDELKKLNNKLYEDILPENYNKSYADPAFSVGRFGKSYGKLLSTVYSELRSLIACAFEGRLAGMTAGMELLIQL